MSEKLTLTLELTSPVFLTGAYKETPELRAASVRGQIRFWLRAMLGATTNDLNKVWQTEESLLGSTQHGSAISIRLYSSTNLYTDKFSLLPHSSQRPSTAHAFKPNQNCKLDLVAYPGQDIPDTIKQAVRLWGLLGGIGKRSRRMLGAFNLSGGNLYEPINSSEMLETAVKDALKAALGADQTVLYGIYPGIPPFPTLNPAHCRILVGHKAFNSAEDANKALFKILRNDDYRPDEDYFGYAKRPNRRNAPFMRRASPLIGQIYRINKVFFLILTIMRSPLQIPDSEIWLLASDWKVHDDFLNDAQGVFNGNFVWGRNFV